MDLEHQARTRSVLRDMLVNFTQLVVALCILAYMLGGPTTRAWMTGFVVGAVSGLIGEPTTSHASAVSTDVPLLRLLGHGCRKEYNYETCEGEVRNISDSPLDNVEVVVSFQDQTGTFVKSESALIEYRPLLPGQTSPFKVATTINPQIRHFSIKFKEMFAG